MAIKACKMVVFYCRRQLSLANKSHATVSFTLENSLIKTRLYSPLLHLLRSATPATSCFCTPWSGWTSTATTATWCRVRTARSRTRTLSSRSASATRGSPSRISRRSHNMRLSWSPSPCPQHPLPHSPRRTSSSTPAARRSTTPRPSRPSSVAWTTCRWCSTNSRWGVSLNSMRPATRDGSSIRVVTATTIRTPASPNGSRTAARRRAATRRGSRSRRRRTTATTTSAAAHQFTSRASVTCGSWTRATRSRWPKWASHRPPPASRARTRWAPSGSHRRKVTVQRHRLAANWASPQPR